MNENASIHDQDDFLKEIDGSIEALFVPTRSIEIDALTNEVKEKTSLLDPAIDTPPPSPPEDHCRENGPSDAPLTLELEPETVSSQVQEEIPYEEKGLAQETTSSPNSLDLLRQSLLSIDWEVSDNTLSELERSLDAVSANRDITESAGASDIISLLKDITKRIRENAPSPSTYIVLALQKGLAGLISIAEEPRENREKRITALRHEIEKTLYPTSNQEVSGYGSELLVQGPERTTQPEAVDTIPIEIEIEDALDKAMGPNVGTEPVIEATSPSVAPGPPPRLSTSTSPSLLPKTEAGVRPEGVFEAAILAHISRLDGWIESIRPIQRLFSSTPGMEKLSAFHERLMKDMGRERDHLSDILENKAGISLGPLTAQGLHPTEEAESKKSRRPLPPPWENLCVVSLEEGLLALDPEEIAFSGRAPWWVRRKAYKAQSFPLRMLKPWPWSRMNTLFTGELGKLDSSTLTSMELPVYPCSAPTKNSALLPRRPYVLVLYARGNGVTLFLSEAPRPFPVSTEWKWNPGDSSKSGLIAGEIKRRGESIPVLSVRNSL